MAVLRDGHAEPMVSAAAFDGGAPTEGWYYDPIAATLWVEFPLASSDGATVSL